MALPKFSIYYTPPASMDLIDFLDIWYDPYEICLNVWVNRSHWIYIEWNAFFEKKWGPKHVTSSGWRTSLACDGNFTVIILSFMAFSMTGNIIWVMWLSKSSNIDLSFTIFMLNHLANTSESIHPKYWKWTIIFVNLVTIWLHLVFNINMKQFDLAIQFEILLSCRFVNSTTETEPLNRYYWKGFNKELAEQLPKIYLCI